MRLFYVRMYTLFLVAYGLCFSPGLSAQQSSPLTGSLDSFSAIQDDIQFDHLSIQDGLSQRDVYAILQDQQGFMWFATRYGVNRYDGFTFSNYWQSPYDKTNSVGNWSISLFEDREGLIWIGTTSGLIQFDPITGQDHKFVNDPDDKESLSNDLVWSVFEDREGIIWVGTDDGLNRYDKSTGRFNRFVHNNDDQTSISSNHVFSFYEDRGGNLWVGTANGLNLYNRSAKQFKRFVHNENLSNERRSDLLYGVPDAPDARPFVIRSIIEDTEANNILWISTEAGLLRLDKDAETYTYLPPDPENPTRSIVMDLVPDPLDQAILWVSTNGGGLYRFDKQHFEFTPYRHNAFLPTSLSSDKLGPLYVDQTGVIWAGSFGNGLNKFHPAKAGFDWYGHVPGQSNSLIDAPVWTIAEDHNRRLWVGTNAGLNVIDRVSGEITHLTHDPNDTASLSSSNINYLYKDRSNTMWVATYGGGLNRWDETTAKFVHYRHDPNDATSIGSDFVSSIFEDANGTLWVSAWDVGLFAFDRVTNRFTHFEHDPDDQNTISDNRIVGFFEDLSGRFWLATYSGLDQFDTVKKTATRYGKEANNNIGLSSRNVFAIHERNREPGVLWIGTALGGLNRFDTQTGKITYYSEENGYPLDRIQGILEDTNGRLWLSTPQGIAKFDVEEESLQMYELNNGLLLEELNLKAHHQNATGEMFFGGVGGLHAFFPEQLTRDDSTPRVIITGLTGIDGTDLLNPSNYSPAERPEHSAIKLKHEQKMLTFNFAGLHFVNPSQNRYAYRLHGFNDDWVAGSERSVSYTNVKPGAYTFSVKAANSDGVWTDEAVSLNLVITPPFWQTAWFYLICFIGVAALLYAGYRQRSRQLRTRAIELSAMVKERTHELLEEKQKTETQANQLLELDGMKNRFFANISHEFRTPLTLLSGLLEDIKSGRYGVLSPDLESQHETMLNNTRRLRRLVDQLLDISRLESGGLEIKKSRGDFSSFLKALIQAFTPLAERHGVKLSFQTEHAQLILDYDGDQLEKVYGNLLSNAIKFTPAGGKVHVTLGKQSLHEQVWAEVKIKDTGSGIPKEALPKIFDRFVQASNENGYVHGGTGIGLALARELVEHHEGQIIAESEPGFGSTFTVRIPIAHAEVNPKAADLDLNGHTGHGSHSNGSHSNGRLAAMLLEEEAILANAKTGTTENGVDKHAPTAKGTNGLEATVLIVEDNTEVRAFLRKHLEEQYQVREADNGKSGLAIIADHPIDLVISDVMMPEMDGYELCRTIRADEGLHLLPVILLTAKAGEQETIHGLAVGADDYIVKPFNMQELKARVATLIKTRISAREQFSREILVQPVGITITSEDEVFLNRVLEVIEANIEQSGFTAGAMADVMGMSRRHLERRITDVTTETPAELLRRMRLERAKQLLKAKSGTIAEVAYAVGYKSPAHFSKAFRKSFGESPSTYSENAA